jgi:hypothetical protein
VALRVEWQVGMARFVDSNTGCVDRNGFDDVARTGDGAAEDVEAGSNVAD